MRNCNSCKKNQSDNNFEAYLTKSLRSKTYLKRSICKNCRNDSRPGVKAEIINNGLKLKRKAFKHDCPEGLKKGGFTSLYKSSDCAIDEMSLDYSEFEDIPDITSIINKKRKGK
jgi:hypothetical protein